MGVVGAAHGFSAARTRITDALLIPHSSVVWAMLYPARYIWTMRALLVGDGLSSRAGTVIFPARFSSHRRRWDDIEAVRFAEAIPDELDEKERAAIRSRVEQKRQLRNKTLLSQPVGPSPLDLIVDPQAQAEWLQHDARSEPPGVDPERITLAQRRIKSRVKFEKLRQHSEFTKVLNSVATYLSQVIVWPQETEGRQWSLTALPSTAKHKPTSDS